MRTVDLMGPGPDGRLVLRGGLLALVLAASAAAGTVDDPEIVDPEGDAGLSGVALPAYADWDVVAAWFEPPAEGILRLGIRVAGGETAPPSGEVGVTFRVGDRHYIAGYTVVPAVFSGGFLSVADANGDVPPDASPQEVPGTFEGGRVTVDLPLDALAVNGSVVLEDPWAWSEYRAGNGEEERLDRTDVGRTAAFGAAPVDGSAAQGGRAATSAPTLIATLAALLIGAAARARP